MKIISHRGNRNGPDPNNENKPDLILSTIKTGLDVEIDLWIHNDKLMLGHDEPQYEIDGNFLFDNRYKLWVHAKNFEALDFLSTTVLHYFWHQGDDYTLTSKNFIWTYPNKMVGINSVIVINGKNNDKYKHLNIHGICTDYPQS